MRFRVVAIPLLAAICLGSPAAASPITEEQMVRGRGARDRSSGGGDSGGSTATRGGGDNNGGRATSRRDDGGDNRGGGARTAQRRDGGADNGPTRTAERTERRDNDNPPAVAQGGDGEQRRAVPRDDRRVVNGRDYDRRGYNGRDYDRRGGYAPRVVVRDRRDINIFNFGSNYYRSPRYYPYHYDRWARSYYRWSPIGYAPWGLIYGSIGFGAFDFYANVPSPYYYGPYAYGSPGPAPWNVYGYDVGGIRLKIRPRDAYVFVDGYYAGLVDDFDGLFQSLRLGAGGHKLEIHMDGFEDLELDVHVQPGRTVTIDEDMRRRP